jgi:hypothetical protein
MGLAEGVEDLSSFGVGDLLAVEHRAHGGVVGYAENGAGEFQGEVKIADQPAEAGAFGGSGERDFQHGFGALGYEVCCAVQMEEGDSVSEGLGEIETEFAAILGGGVPAALREGETVDGETD